MRHESICRFITLINHLSVVGILGFLMNKSYHLVWGRKTMRMNRNMPTETQNLHPEVWLLHDDLGTSLANHDYHSAGVSVM